MRFPFLKIRRLQSGTEIVESRVLCADLAEALTIFRPAKDCYVCSEASYHAGLPKPLPPERCRSCGQRPAVLAYGHFTGRCGKCQSEVHREQQERSFKRKRDLTPLPPAMVAEMRRELAAQTVSASGKSGKQHGPRIEVERSTRRAG